MDELYMQNEGGAGGVLRVQLPICDRTLTSEISSDISLPDYQPEIKRLLRVSASVQPPSRYVGGGAMEFSGMVDLCVYYTGNDGRMYCYPTAAEYVLRTPLEAGADFDLNDAPVYDVQSEVESLISRVSGPRRMSVKCRLRSRVSAHGSCVVEEKRSGARHEGMSEERLLCESEVAVVGYGTGAPFTVTDEVLLEHEDGMTDDVRIISGDAQVLIGEVLCLGGAVNCRGEVLMKLLLEREEEGALPFTVTRKVPFDHSIAMDAATANGEAAVCGCCTELKLSMEDNRVLCEAEVLLEARTLRKQTLSYVCDRYAVGADSTTEYKSYTLPQAIRCHVGNFTQNEVRTLEELGLNGSARVVDVSGEATVEQLGSERGRAVVSGKCRYTVIVSLDGEMTAKEIDAPWRYVVEGVKLAEDTPLHWEGQAQSIGVRARMDGERVALDGEIGLWLRLLGQRDIEAVSGINVGAPSARTAGQMLLCYPSREDSLWSVGKRYHVALDDLAERNRIESAHRADEVGSLGGAHVLII